MNGYSHIIWDWNGTLLDDVWLCVEIMNGMLNRRGIRGMDSGRYKAIIGFPIEAYYVRAGFDFSKETYDSAATEFCDEYERRVGECRLHDGVKALLEKCAASGFRQSILSATEQARLERMIDAFEINALFDRVIGQPDHHAIGKLATAEQLVESLGAPRDSVLLIGDTDHDGQIAKDVGIDCVLVAIGHQAREKLEAIGARVLDDLSQITTVLMEQHVPQLKGLNR